MAHSQRMGIAPLKWCVKSAPQTLFEAGFSSHHWLWVYFVGIAWREDPDAIKEFTQCKRGDARECTHNLVLKLGCYPVCPGESLWCLLAHHLLVSATSQMGWDTSLSVLLYISKFEGTFQAYRDILIKLHTTHQSKPTIITCSLTKFMIKWWNVCDALICKLSMFWKTTLRITLIFVKRRGLWRVSYGMVVHTRTDSWIVD